MFNLSCGINGRVRLVKSLECGTVTQEVSFNNSCTNDWLNIISISNGNSPTPRHPTAIHYGSGTQPEPFSEVTTLANRVGSRDVNYSDSGWSGAGEYETIGDNRVLTRTRSVTVGARGVDWNLSELGLYMGIPYNKLCTYTLVKNELGETEPLNVSAIEILTIYYTIQYIYPAKTVLQMVSTEPGEYEGEVTIEFMPKNFGNTGNYLRNGPTSGLLERSTGIFTGSRVIGNIFNGGQRWGENQINGESRYFLKLHDHMPLLLTFDPPVTKDNTQVFDLFLKYQWADVEPVEV